MEERIKVYLDANIISNPLKVENFENDEIKGLKDLSENLKVSFYISEVTKEEIQGMKESKMKNYLLFLYNVFFSKIPKENIIKRIGALNTCMFNQIAFNESINKEDDLFIKLKQCLSPKDAEQVFQAEKNNLDYFLTLDKKTIIRHREEIYKKIPLLKIKIYSPKELYNKLNNLCPHNEKNN